MTRERLLNDLSVQWTVITPLYNIGEQVSNLTKEFKEVHPEILWNVVSGLRHRVPKANVCGVSKCNWFIYG